MSTQKTNDGGPEFPVYGMSLRDWFAGMALPTAIERCAATGITQPNLVAHDCYAYADAMLSEKENNEH